MDRAILHRYVDSSVDRQMVLFDKCIMCVCGAEFPSFSPLPHSYNTQFLRHYPTSLTTTQHNTKFFCFFLPSLTTTQRSTCFGWWSTSMSSTVVSWRVHPASAGSVEQRGESNYTGSNMSCWLFSWSMSSQNVTALEGKCWGLHAVHLCATVSKEVLHMLISYQLRCTLLLPLNWTLPSGSKLAPPIWKPSTRLLLQVMSINQPVHMVSCTLISKASTTLTAT